MSKEGTKHAKSSIAIRVLACVCVIALLPVFLVFLVLEALLNCVVLVVLWLVWLPRGKDTLVVFSNSPHWQRYFREEIIPILECRCTTLNWSDRKQWPSFSWATLAFRRFAGSREFNPMVIYFAPLRWPRRFRFYRAIHDHRRGKDETLETVTDQLSRCLRVDIPMPSNGMSMTS